MAASAWAVIGAGYGDEGKGLMVDALAHALGPDTIVARTNGGAQAGHSVQTPDGRRHVFHHVAAGALAGAATHLARRFVHHPMLLSAEVEALERLGASTAITADPRGYVTHHGTCWSTSWPSGPGARASMAAAAMGSARRWGGARRRRTG